MSHTLDVVQRDAFDTGTISEAAQRQSAAALDHIPDSFGRRLRAVRERQRISIASIAESTKILGALLEGLENDDVSRWPTGLYRRAFIRAYATAIGLDPEPVVREFIARFPDPEEPAVAPAPAPLSQPPRAVLRLTLAEPGGLTGATLAQTFGRRVLAVAADAAAIGIMGSGIFAVLGAFWPPFTLAVIVYFVAAVLLLGNTPGVCLAASTTHRSRAGRDPQARRHMRRPSWWPAARERAGQFAGILGSVKDRWLSR